MFAPLFHELISHANFSMSAKLSSITRFLTIVRLAYPSFKQDLDDAIRGRSGLPDDERIAVSQLRDLKKLLNFFIPVVSGQFTVGLPDASVTMTHHGTAVDGDVEDVTCFTLRSRTMRLL